MVRFTAFVWGAESPSQLRGGPTGPATISRRPWSSAFFTPAFRPFIDLALTRSRRQGRTTDTGGPRLHPDTSGVSTYMEVCQADSTGWRNTAGFDEVERPSAFMPSEDARVYAQVPI